MTLTAAVRVRRRDFALDVALNVAPDEVLGLVGPNGAGKSTALHAIAGLVPSQGNVDATGRIGLVFQDRRLFPHLSVLDNVAFGADRATARRWLDQVGLAGHANNKPRELSGGEAQRVALARTLATRPSVLLLDEPFTALDVASRAIVSRLINEFDGPRIVVTHATAEALATLDRVVVIEAGRVTQEGTVDALAAHPATSYVADVVGVNRLVGTADGTTTVALDVGGAIVAAEPVAPGRVAITFHPRAVAVHDRTPEGSPRNVFMARIVDVDRHGERARLTLAGPPRLVAEVTASAADELRLTPGRDIWAAVKATEVTVTAA